MATGNASPAASATTTTTTATTTTTPAARLTRGALKKITNTSSTGRDQALLQQYAEFQHGLRTPKVKRRRVGSSTSESTTENDQDHVDRHDAVAAPPAEQENQKPSKTTAANTMAVVDSPATAQAPQTNQDGSTAGSATVEDGPTTPAVTMIAVTPTVAEIALAQDEKKLDGAPAGELFVVTVLSSSEIAAADDVETEVAAVESVLTIKTAVADARRDDKEETDLSWAKEYAALDSLRRLAIHHRERLVLLMDGAGVRVMRQLVCPAAMNLRSAMVRNALLCIQDLVAAIKQDAERYYGDIIPVLLQRTANEKQFIRDLARDALVACVDASPSETLLTEFLRISTTEKNAQIVSTAGLYTQKCIGRMDKAKLKTFVLVTHASFLEEMSAFLNCKVVECKAAARKTLQFLRRHIGETDFTTLAKTKLEGTAQFELLKASEEKKSAPAKSGIPKLSMRERMMQMKKQQAANGATSAVSSKSDDVVVLVPDATR